MYIMAPIQKELDHTTAPPIWNRKGDKQNPLPTCRHICGQEHINDLPVRQEHINRFGELARYWEHVDKLEFIKLNL